MKSYAVFFTVIRAGLARALSGQVSCGFGALALALLQACSDGNATDVRLERLSHERRISSAPSDSFSRDRFGGLQGTIVSVDGSGYGGVEIRIIAVRASGHTARSDTGIASEWTDASGRFQFRGLEYGSYDVFVLSPDGERRSCRSVAVFDAGPTVLPAITCTPRVSRLLDVGFAGLSEHEVLSVNSIYSEPWGEPVLCVRFGDLVELERIDGVEWPSAVLIEFATDTFRMLELGDSGETCELGYRDLGRDEGWALVQGRRRRSQQVGVHASHSLHASCPYGRVELVSQTGLILHVGWADRWGQFWVPDLGLPRLLVRGYDRYGRPLSLAGFTPGGAERPPLRLPVIGRQKSPPGRADILVFVETGNEARVDAQCTLLVNRISGDESPVSKSATDQFGFAKFRGVDVSAGFRVGLALGSDSGDVVRWVDDGVFGWVGGEAMVGVVQLGSHCVELDLGGLRGPGVDKLPVSVIVRDSLGRVAHAYRPKSGGALHIRGLSAGRYSAEILLDSGETLVFEVHSALCARPASESGR